MTGPVIRSFLYHYEAKVMSVYDGDTITVDIQLGLDIELRNQKIRLAGIDAPEMRGEEKVHGKISRDWLRDKILGKTVIIRTEKDKKGKYGRYLGWIFTLDGKGKSINTQMVELGLADSYK